MSDASVRFTLLGVPAGEYVLTHASVLALFGLQGRQGWWMAQPVTVGSTNIQDLVVTVRPALRVEGRMEFRAVAATPPPAPGPSMGFDTPNGEPGRFAGQMSSRRDGTFSTVAAGGQ